MTDLTDTELDALAERLKTAWWMAPRASDFGPVAREAARYFAERERERLGPLRVAVEALDLAYSESFDPYTKRAAAVVMENEARFLLESDR